MDKARLRRASSAGYRLPPPPPPLVGAPPQDGPSGPSGSSGRRTEPALESRDPVKEERLWRELLWAERRAVRRWEKNWSFLHNYNHLVRLRSEEPSANEVSLSSDSAPHTSNQVVGSRLATPLADTLQRLDTLLWTGGHHRRHRDPEILPC